MAARLVERILGWIAAVVAIAALIAVAINFLPGVLPNFPRLNPGQAIAPAIDRAEQALSRGDTREAVRLADAAVAEDSSDATVDNRAGNVALRAGDTSAAEHDYLAGENADPHYAWNYVNLGQLYQREGKKEPADAQLRAASVAAPNQPFIHYDLGVVEMQEKLYAAALADFEAELRRSPSYRPAVIGRAEALQKMGRPREAVALYRKAGIAAGAQNVKPPALAVKPIAQPSPSPRPSPSPQPSPTAQPSPTPTPTPARVVAVITPIPRARPQPSVTDTPARPPWATQPPAEPSGGASGAPFATARRMSEVSSDARNYVLDVAQDLGFTRTLPAADPNQSTEVLRASLNRALARKQVDVDPLLRIGTAALLSGRIALASYAYGAASQNAPQDWRGPYFAALAAQAGGDLEQARGLLRTSVTREPRAEAYTSLAVVDLQTGDDAAAAANARIAVGANPSYEPGRFVAGMIYLIRGNIPGAEANLLAAQALGGAPARTAYFLNALRNNVGAANSP